MRPYSYDDDDNDDDLGGERPFNKGKDEDGDAVGIYKMWPLSDGRTHCLVGEDVTYVSL